MIEMTIGIVFRNEAAHFAGFFDALAMALPNQIHFEVLGYDNNSRDSSAETFEQNCKNRKWKFRIQKSERNNMGEARAWILEHSSSELVYFIDVDVTPDSNTILLLSNALSQHINDSSVCAASGPLQVSGTNEFQKRLALLQASWWGNFGSAQMKNSFAEKLISHAPTAHLLVKRSDYLKAGSFNTSFDKTGEDLEIHWRLSQMNKKILWVKEAHAKHQVAQDLIQWLKKSFKYGAAQTQTARVHLSFFLTRKCLPLWLFLVAIYLIGEAPLYFCIFVALYFFSILVSAARLSPRYALAITGLLFSTHIFYLFGEIFGLLRSPATPTKK